MKTWLKDKIKLYFPEVDFDILIPPAEELGDYSTNIAFKMAETQVPKEKPEEIAKEIIAKLKQDKELINVFEKIEVVRPGFINFYLSNNFLKKSLVDIIKNDKYGFNETMRGKTVMVEYTDPNPFKLFHIGHLMSNTIGESIARLYEASGAKVLRANYQGDVGLHVAKAIWGMLKQNQESKINNLEKWNMDRIGQAYAAGAKAYEENENARKEIEDINVKIYDRSDEDINKAYDLGRKLSLDYFETIYKKLGTKFDRYFFESEAADDGLKIVKEHPEVFVESEGAKVFKGERYGLHTRVFVNSQGLPTYEAKELGVNKKKFDQDKLDLSIIITGNEINEYFKVLLKVMELTIPEVAKKTKHISHGMLRLPGGKMSSRTGEIITVELLIKQVKSKLPESETDEIKDKIAISAIKYSILKQSPGRDIIFDFEKSLSVKGDSAPYLQYTYARLRSILDK
jgi:arginyl-tRNA synthetase